MQASEACSCWCAARGGPQRGSARNQLCPDGPQVCDGFRRLDSQGRLTAFPRHIAPTSYLNPLHSRARATAHTTASKSLWWGQLSRLLLSWHRILTSTLYMATV